MDWLKLFALLVAVASVQITADAPKKKIRIHLPQKVKHIHHHKKIYITNHPASSQYAPAFMPSAEGAVAMPTNVAMPAVANVLPLSSVELYDESPTRMPGISSAASKLLPLYRARGYYGPTPTEWEEQDYDLSPPEESSEISYIPTGYSAPPGASPVSPKYPPKRKNPKYNEPSRNKAPRKVKPKRVAVRNKPQPQLDDEHPVTTFHEQFYSDVDGSGTIRKVKKPQRVEKIIDGDTEHIHTYSEEHIHKLVFDDGSRIPGVVGLESVGGLPALAPPHPLPPFPIKNSQALIAIPPETLTGFSAVGSMGTPPHLEYAAYNPREVTHDHIFHDHGEIPSGVDLTKNHLPFPPRMTYTGQGFRVGLNGKDLKNKHRQKYLKHHQKPSHLPDFSYYENMYVPYNKFRNVQKPTIPTSFEPTNEAGLDDYRPVVPSFKVKNKGHVKNSNVVPGLYYGHGKQVGDFRLPQASAPAPYSVSSTVVHEYKPKHYVGYTGHPGAVGLSKFNKDIYSYTNDNYDFDTYALPSNVYPTENYPQNFPFKKGKKKSISTQNISFGGLDHQTTVDHLQNSGISATSIEGNVPTAFESNYDQGKLLDSASSTVYTIRETSPAHPYYNAMAVKALHNNPQSIAEASNDNFQYAEAPSLSTTPNEPTVATTTTPPQEYFNVQSSEAITTEPTNYDTRPRGVTEEQSVEVHNTTKERRPRYKILALQPKSPAHASYESGQNYYNSGSVSVMGKLKYGDKI
ncbi:uncharacterized protein LOC142986606 [Anticarsia gemmatalis]|uniref:uncharacterized protein LOC142986606 n=1 Tax=Anticarsia gemmatalis TaxID=129554 RepID=UPI003F77525C